MLFFPHQTLWKEDEKEKKNPEEEAKVSEGCSYRAQRFPQKKYCEVSVQKTPKDSKTVTNLSLLCIKHISGINKSQISNNKKKYVYSK